MSGAGSYTMASVMQRARDVRVTDVCRKMGYKLREAGMNYVLADNPSVTIRRGNRGWTDRALRAGGRTGPETGGGCIEFLMRFGHMSRDDAMMAVLEHFEPDMAAWVRQTREDAQQEKKHGLARSERRPFSEKIREIRAAALAAREQRDMEER